MGLLGDIMGEEFEEKYEEESEKRRQAQRKVDQETLIKICYEAIYGGGFDGEEPRFTFEGEEVDHDVVLMESPREELSKFKHTFEDSGNISLGMFHMGDLWSCIFNEETKPLVDKIQTDSYYLVVGRYKENVTDKGTSDEQVYKNISPVRGILPLPKAKEFAEKFKESMDAASVEEQSKEQTSEDDMDLDIGEEPEVSDEDIVRVFKAIGKKKKEVLQGTASGNSDDIDTLVKLTQNNIDGDADRERILDLFESEVEEIDGRGEEEEDEDDDLDLDIGGGSESEDESSSGSTPEETSSQSTDDSEDSSESDPSDWF